MASNGRVADTELTLQDFPCRQGKYCAVGRGYGIGAVVGTGVGNGNGLSHLEAIPQPGSRSPHDAVGATVTVHKIQTRIAR
ncbi:hypothetical protein GCM10027217_25760 [Pseudomaricurvus hydrocarbonicus]